MVQVKYAGNDRKFKYPYNVGIRRADGLIQLDGKEEWRLPKDFRNPLCFGWHDLGDSWEIV